MAFVNSIFRPIIDLVLLPFSSLPPFVGVAVLSLVLAVCALLVYKFVSNQDAIKVVKDEIAAGFFEMRLFNDDLGAMLRAQSTLMRSNLRYATLNLLPLVVMTILFLPVFAQMYAHYHFLPLEVGQSSVLTATFEEPIGAVPEIEVPAGLKLSAPPVVVPSLNEVSWRLVGELAGDYDVGLTVGGESFTKSVSVGKQKVRRVSQSRQKNGLVDQMLAPGEAVLPSSAPIHGITLEYEAAEIDSWITEMNWVYLMLLLSIVFAFALRKPLGVTF